MGKSRNKQQRSCDKEETQLRKLQRQYDEAKKEIKRLKNIVKRTNPDRLRELNELEERRRENNKFEDAQPKEKKSNGPRCTKCEGFKVKLLTFTRADGSFVITICEADHCNHRSPPVKVQTDSNSNCENKEFGITEVDDEY